MTTARGLLLGVLGLGWAAGGVAAAAATAPPVRLLAPVDGATLRAGDTVELSWVVEGPWPGREPEEWEAFLSLDGGRSWPVRLTPHLDAHRRRTTFRVPALPTATARLLLRVGDEHEETAIPIPVRLRIEADPFARGAELLARPGRHPGEAALPGGAPVVRWVEGGRDGSGSLEVAARSLPVADPAVPYFGGGVGGGPAEEPGGGPEAPSPPATKLVAVVRAAVHGRRLPLSGRPAGRALRLLLAQQNE